MAYSKRYQCDKIASILYNYIIQPLYYNWLTKIHVNTPTTSPRTVPLTPPIFHGSLPDYILYVLIV